MSEEKTPLAAYMRRKRLVPKDLASVAETCEQSVRYWMLGQRRPNSRHSQRLHNVLRIPMHVLRPDLFPVRSRKEKSREREYRVA